jgi:lysophospholipase L1-like esterase
MIEVQHTKPETDSPGQHVSRRRFFYNSGALLFTTSFLTSCSGLLDDIIPSKKEPEAEAPLADQTLAFFGDSLTIGTGGSTAYGKFVGQAFPKRPVEMDGIRGQIALSISIRQGGTPLKISVEGGKFDGIKEVKVTKLSNEFLSTPIDTESYTRSGTVAGVKCTITRTEIEEIGEGYTIKPDAESVVEIPDDSVFELEKAARLKTATQILWYGRNNIGKVTAEDEIITALDNSIAYISEPKRYLVLGVLLATPEDEGTEDYNQVTAINEKLAAKYGKSFVPMTPPTDAEMAAIGYTPTAEDLADLEKKNFPTGLRPANNTDEIHINDKGYQIVANRVIDKIKELKY